MQHPSPSRLREMADKFEALMPKSSPFVDFEQPFVRQHPCGTVACHGGWAGVALGVIFGNNADDEDEDYIIGARALARFLNPEWSHSSHFEDWTIDNPKLWGNAFGFKMFTSGGHKAFDQPRNFCTLTHIANWYRAVADRIDAVLDATDQAIGAETK